MQKRLRGTRYSAQTFHACFLTYSPYCFESCLFFLSTTILTGLTQQGARPRGDAVAARWRESDFNQQHIEQAEHLRALIDEGRDREVMQQQRGDAQNISISGTCNPQKA